MSYLNNHPSWETRQQREERQEIKEPEVSEKVIQKFTRSELIDMTKEEQTIIQLFFIDGSEILFNV